LRRRVARRSCAGSTSGAIDQRDHFGGNPFGVVQIDLASTIELDLAIAFFDADVDVAAVKAAIARKADEIGWHDVPRPAPKSETIYRVIRKS
jgi:hypothetical protein